MATTDNNTTTPNDAQEPTNSEPHGRSPGTFQSSREFFKWCEEHPDELEKRIQDHFPNLEISGTKATMNISDKLWEAYEREFEAEWLEANAGKYWREEVREIERRYFGY